MSTLVPDPAAVECLPAQKDHIDLIYKQKETVADAPSSGSEPTKEKKKKKKKTARKGGDYEGDDV
eukprot:2480404-Alexandrium_andersonii.AAC.1